MNGLAPLTPTTILHWSELHHVTLSPKEVDGLIAVDGVLLFPGKPEDDERIDG